jgi:hypothetical protein
MAKKFFCLIPSSKTYHYLKLKVYKPENFLWDLYILESIIYFDFLWPPEKVSDGAKFVEISINSHTFSFFYAVDKKSYFWLLLKPSVISSSIFYGWYQRGLVLLLVLELIFVWFLKANNVFSLPSLSLCAKPNVVYPTQSVRGMRFSFLKL